MTFKMSQLVVVSALTVSIGIVATSVGYTQPTRNEHNHGAESNVSRRAAHHENKKQHFRNTMKQLNVSDEQKVQLKESRDRFRAEHADELTRLKAQREQLKSLKSDPSAKESRQALRTEMRASYEKLHEQRKASMQGILTPEQKRKFNEIQAKRHAQRQERHQHRQETRQQSQ